MRFPIFYLEWGWPGTTKGRVIESLLDEWNPNVAVLTNTASGWFGG